MRTLAFVAAMTTWVGVAQAQDQISEWREIAKQTPIWTEMTKKHPEVRDLVLNPNWSSRPLTLGLFMACVEVELMNFEAYGDIKTYSIAYDTPMLGFGEPRVVLQITVPKKEVTTLVSLRQRGSQIDIPKVQDGDNPYETAADIRQVLAPLTGACTSFDQFNSRGKLYKEPKELIELKKKGKIFTDRTGQRTN